VTPARIYLGQAECSKLLHVSEHWKEGMVFLFNDVVLFTKHDRVSRTPTFRRRLNRPKKTVRNCYKYKFHWPTNRLQIVEQQTKSETLCLQLLASDGTTAESTMLTIPSEDIRNSFARILSTAISNANTTTTTTSPTHPLAGSG
jgi:hypothetical protein